MNQSENITELATALAKAQGQIEGTKKSGSNPHLRNKYADLSSAWEACREPLSVNGLAVVQAPTFEGGFVTVTTRLMHSSGQWLESALTLPVAQSNAQGVGSAVTYGRRYSLMALVGIAPADDDGEEASNPTPTSKPKPEARTQPSSNPDSITGAQVQALAIVLKTAGFGGDEESKVEGRDFLAFAAKSSPIRSVKDLSKIQAQTALDAMGEQRPEGYRTDEFRLEALLKDWNTHRAVQSQGGTK